METLDLDDLSLVIDSLSGGPKSSRFVLHQLDEEYWALGFETFNFQNCKRFTVWDIAELFEVSNFDFFIVKGYTFKIVSKSVDHIVLTLV